MNRCKPDTLEDRVSSAMVRLAAVLLGLALSACMSAPSLQPKQFMTLRQAFPDPATRMPPTTLPDAAVFSAFDASFEDVFRLASVSASQAQFHVEEQYKSEGLILASRSVLMRPHGTAAEKAQPSWASTPHLYFYAISIRELGPKQTEVRLAAKVQGKCGLWPASLKFASLGIGVPMMNQENAHCEELSKGMWATDAHTSAAEMKQFLIFLRNNLLAAGLI